ncbi:hypothetical protein RB7113 [Rhodopirellula baltica SH 1]|uniref:Uncharacterized protein n=1 Tax=Rhodopirellula baltica (strain DSM 10527 / NCIMB 13988 / SH1) TaxID=243090 RepID=Q7UP76_RHOBA|nr:hypothetical protein RB7113 [Rhodopirellula baltica SH 1]
MSTYRDNHFQETSMRAKWAEVEVGREYVARHHRTWRRLCLHTSESR